MTKLDFIVNLTVVDFTLYRSFQVYEKQLAIELLHIHQNESSYQSYNKGYAFDESTHRVSIQEYSCTPKAVLLSYIVLTFQRSYSNRLVAVPALSAPTNPNASFNPLTSSLYIHCPALSVS